MLLVEYFRLVIADQDVEAFRGRVAARYGEETLCRLLTDAPGIDARRASALTLGTVGGFRRSNPVLALAAGDTDYIVRNLAADALWAIWFRGRHAGEQPAAPAGDPARRPGRDEGETWRPA